jgi:uncharacterized delta-60 repeat protein
MKYPYINLCLVLLLTLTACSKSNNPKPDDGTNVPEPEQPVTGSQITFDPTFKSITGFASYHAAVQADGKIILDAYSKINNTAVISIYRLNKNGVKDNTFDIDVDKTWVIKSISGIFILADGKVLVAGEFTINGQKKPLVRLSSTGRLDNAYISPLLPVNVSFQRTADGKVFAYYVIKRGYDFDPHADAYIVRLNSDGSQDSGFAFSTLDEGGTLYDRITAMVPLINGKIIVSGVFTVGNGVTKRQNVIRINSDGSIDNDFNFKEIPKALATIEKIAVQTDGKIVLSGNFTGFTNPDIRDANYNYYAIARLNANGALDEAFAVKDGFTFSNYISDLALFSDNKILANWIGISANSSYGISYLELFKKDGGVDNSFSLQNNKVSLILKEAPDQFLVLGEININNVIYPIARLKYK